MKKLLSALVVAATFAGTAAGVGVPAQAAPSLTTVVAHSAQAMNRPLVTQPRRLTMAQKQAIGAAQSYLRTSAFSKAGLMDQLSSPYGSQFRRTDAEFAVNYIKVNWNKQALKAAKSYLRLTHFSRQGLIDQLTSEYGSKFTQSQAVYGVNRIGLR